jgi:hypothetical protein
VCFVVHKTTLELERVILTTLYLISAKNTFSWCARKGDLQRTFPLDILMVPSSAFIIAADGERPSCDVFSLGESICLGSFEFIADYFGGLSLSPMRGDSGAAFMGSTCSGTLSLRWTMTEDSTEEFLTTSNGEGDSVLPSQRRCVTGLRSLLSWPHHGWRTLRPLRP